MPATKPRKPQTDEEADASNPAVAEAEAILRERPEGMPGVYPLHALPRRKRADVELRLADCVDALDQVRKDQEALQESDQAGMLRLHAKTQAAVQDIAEALALGAVGPDAEKALLEWAEKADEATVLQGFAWYMGTLQPGEAGGSQ